MSALYSKELSSLMARNLAPVEGGERALRSIYLPPFQKACVESGSLSIMTAYSSYDGVPVVSDARKLSSNQLCSSYTC